MPVRNAAAHDTMAETNPELQAKLQELDHELEEGDITQKGSVLPCTAVMLHFHCHHHHRSLYVR